MTFSIREAKELVELANFNNVNVMVGHVLLFHPALTKIKNIINQVELANCNIYSIDLTSGKSVQRKMFLEFSPHDIAIFHYLTDSTPKKISANGSTFTKGNT